MSARFALADRPSSKTGRLRWWVAGLSLSVGAALLGTALLNRVETPAVENSSARAGLAAVALQDLVGALEQRDPQAAGDLAPVDEAAAQQLRAAAHNARAVDLTDLSARYVDQVGAVAADGSWTAAVDLTWAVAGFDASPLRAEVLVGFAPVGDSVAITHLGGGDRGSPLWLSGPLAVRRGPDSLVLATGRGAERQAKFYARRVDRAIPVVRRMLPQWRPSVVVEVPASAAGLDAALGVPRGTYAGTAAVTTPARRVFVNPAIAGGLRGAGAQIVMSHELVHVATDTPTGVMDAWLLEGFADYVALRDVGLPATTTAARAVASVRREGVPDRLPDSTDFDSVSGPGASDLVAAYEFSWLACVEVAEQVGEQGLLRVYRRASAGANTGEALASVGLSTAGVLSGWQQRLRSMER